MAFENLVRNRQNAGNQQISPFLMKFCILSNINLTVSATFYLDHLKMLSVHTCTCLKFCLVKVNPIPNAKFKTSPNSKGLQTTK